MPVIRDLGDSGRAGPEIGGGEATEEASPPAGHVTTRTTIKKSWAEGDSEQFLHPFGRYFPGVSKKMRLGLDRYWPNVFSPHHIEIPLLTVSSLQHLLRANVV